MIRLIDRLAAVCLFATAAIVPGVFAGIGVDLLWDACGFQSKLMGWMVLGLCVVTGFAAGLCVRLPGRTAEE